DRLSVTGAVVMIAVPRRRQPLRLNVADVRFLRGPRAGWARVTMSASLAQTPRPAPVTLLASTGEGESAVACSLAVTGLEIEPLGLPQIFELPLSRLRGSGSGRLNIKVSTEGVTNKFSCSLTVRRLDAQPIDGPELPVIDRAEFALEAVYDWVTHALRMDSIRLRLPGMDLAGKGRIHAEALAGGWEGIRRLEVAGKVNPLRVAALLWGKAPVLPGGLTVEGDLDVRF
ncbi:unnamed protein product, partial [marine sediment metagenome]